MFVLCIVVFHLNKFYEFFFIIIIYARGSRLGLKKHRLANHSTLASSRTPDARRTHVTGCHIVASA
jgi:hypothetical protein